MFANIAFKPLPPYSTFVFLIETAKTSVLGVTEFNQPNVITTVNDNVLSYRFESSDFTVESLSIYDISGKKLTFENLVGNTGNYDLNSLSTGLYIASFKIKNQGFKEFSKFQFDHEDIKDIIGPYLYKYYHSFIKSEEIFKKLLNLLKTVKKIRDYRFFKNKLKELDEIINDDLVRNNISNEFDEFHENQQAHAQAYNNWFQQYLFIETINIKVKYNKLKIKSYSVTDNLSSNQHLKKIIKNTKLNRISNLSSDNILIR